jgi:hypothetical protein
VKEELLFEMKRQYKTHQKQKSLGYIVGYYMNKKQEGLIEKHNKENAICQLQYSANKIMIRSSFSSFPCF